MRKFLLGLLTGVVLVLLALVVVGAALGRLAANRPPTVPDRSVLVLDLTGDIPETPQVEIPLPMFEAQTPPTVRELWSALRAAAQDRRIRAVLLEPHGLSAGWAKLEELRDQLRAFQRSGKPVYAYLQSPSSREYYLAAGADQIFTSPDDLVDVKGFRIEAAYLKGTLDKLGIAFEVDHVGKYKDAGDMLTRNSMSPETREVLNSVLDQLYGDFSTVVAAGRHKTAEEVQRLIDRGPFLAIQAKQYGLVDELGYEDSVVGRLKEKLRLSDLRRIGIKAYRRVAPSRGQRFALLVGEGDIIRGQGDDSLNSGNIVAANAFVRLVRQLQNDGSIRGVVLRIDSPGGDAVASDEILHQLKVLSAVKPVVISMSDVAASGGYFAAMTGDPIVAYPNTITGSIGVIYGKANLRELYGKIGITKEIISRGRLADIDSDYTKLSEAGREKLREGIEATYQSFVTKVSQARHRSYREIDQLAQGRVWMGAQARQNGLVDELGGLDRAVALLRQKAHLARDAEVTLVPYPGRKSLLEVLTESTPESLLGPSQDERVKLVRRLLPSAALVQGGLLRLMPYRFVIQ